MRSTEQGQAACWTTGPRPPPGSLVHPESLTPGAERHVGDAGRVGARIPRGRREEQSPLQPALPGMDTARRRPWPWPPRAPSWGATTGTAAERQCPAGEAGAEDERIGGEDGGPGGQWPLGDRQDQGCQEVAAGERRACTASWRRQVREARVQNFWLLV